MKTIHKVIILATLWAIIVSPGRVSGDTMMRLNMAHAWWTGEAEVSVPPDYRPKSRLEMPGVKIGDRYYPAYDLGQSMLMLPGDWLATQLHRLFPRQNEQFFRQFMVAVIIFIPLNVAVVVSGFWFLKLLYFPEPLAALSSCLWLLSTTVLTYANDLQQNHQILLFCLLGYACALVNARSGQPRMAIASGLVSSAALLVRTTSILNVATIVLFLIVASLYHHRDRFQCLKSIGFWIVGFLPLTLFGVILNYLRYGVFGSSGLTLMMNQLNSDSRFISLPPLPKNYPFINPPWVGIWGALFSPAKSIFLYDPLLLPGLILGVLYWRKLASDLKLYMMTVILSLGLHLVFYSRLDFWHGDPGWGARYFVTTVHLLLLPLIPLLLQYLILVKGLLRWLIISLIGVAIFLQLLSITLRPSSESGRIYFAQSQSFLEFRTRERIDNLRCLIDSSSLPSCPDRLLTDRGESLETKISLLPFLLTKGFQITFTLWGILLLIALALTTLYFSTWLRNLNTLPKTRV
jgi:hypothetical protein